MDTRGRRRRTSSGWLDARRAAGAGRARGVAGLGGVAEGPRPLVVVILDQLPLPPAVRGTGSVRSRFRTAADVVRRPRHHDVLAHDGPAPVPQLLRAHG